MVLLPDTTMEMATRTAKRLIERVSEDSPSDLPPTTVSIGIARNHPEDGARILAPIPSMRRVSSIVEAHQENWDGSGYPFKLSGEEIPKAARIVSIADAYHAMVSTRPYRKGMSVDKACSILTNGAGKQWDERLVETFVKLHTG